MSDTLNFDIVPTVIEVGMRVYHLSGTIHGTVWEVSAVNEGRDGKPKVTVRWDDGSVSWAWWDNLRVVAITVLPETTKPVAKWLGWHGSTDHVVMLVRLVSVQAELLSEIAVDEGPYLVRNLTEPKTLSALVRAIPWTVKPADRVELLSSLEGIE